MSSNGPAHDPLELVRNLAVQLRRRDRDVEVIFNLLPIGIGIAADPECRDIRVNKAFAEQLGITTGENASLSAPEGTRPGFKVFQDGRELAADDLPMQYAARHGVEVRGVEVDVVHPDGRRVSLYECAAPLFDEEGQVRGAIGAFVDISERRRVEQEQRFLADASRVLASSLDVEATLRALARLAVPVFGDYCAVDVHRDDGSFVRVEFVIDDPSKQRLADGLKRYPPTLTIDSPAARAIRLGEIVVCNECPPDILTRAAQDEAHRTLLLEFSVTSFVMVPLRSRGRALGLLTVGSLSGRQYAEADVALATDIAARASLALDNALLYRHAQEANRLKEEFLATLSHELRTPLNALLGWTHLLKTASLDEGARAKALESIDRNAHAQAVLINDLLDVSRISNGRLRLEERPVDMPAVALAAVDAVRPAARARDIDMNVCLAPLAADVVGDADRLQQVVWNLLSNAVKFTPPGGRIDLSMTQAGGAVQIVVADTGLGIDPVFLPHVFERFRQGDSTTTRAQSGLGLGLAIVRHLVDLHGGTVSADSEGPGRGARFVVTLPARPAATPVAETLGPAGDLPASLDGVRVLAVDADEDGRERILAAVRGAGAEVMVVNSVASALDVCGAFEPDVIVADTDTPRLFMHEISGRGARLPPVIGVSGEEPARAERQAQEAGFATCVGKPADAHRLVPAIATVLNRVRS